MYFKGILSVDPKELTKIKIEKPSGNFKKIFHTITGGKIGDKKEIETFKAIALVQSIYSALSSIGINNIIRINHDDLEIFYDNKGEKDDFELAMTFYSIEIDDSMSTYFNQLWLVLEHDDKNFKYLIEISINRTHEVGEYPIEIIVSGLLKETKVGISSKTELKKKLNTVFKSQDDYNNYISSKQIEFNTFLSTISFELGKQMKLEEIKQIVKTRMLIQRGTDENPALKKKPKFGDVPYHYYGFEDYIFSSILWSDLIFELGFNIASFELIDELGSRLFDIDDKGVDAISGSIFDNSVDLNLATASLSSDSIVENIDMSDSLSTVAEEGCSWFDLILDNIDFS